MSKIMGRMITILLAIVVIFAVVAFGYVVAIYGFNIGGQCYSNQQVERISYEHTLTVNYVHFTTPADDDVTVHADDQGATVTQVGDRISYCVPSGGGVAYNFQNNSLGEVTP